MTQTINSAIGQTFTLTTKYDLAVADSFSSRNVTIGTNAVSTYWRTYLASSATPGTPSTTLLSPKSLAAHVENQLRAGGAGSIWSVASNTAGFITITYTGTGTGTITWDAGNIIRNLLGFDAAISLTNGQTATAAYHPTHMLFTISRRDDTGWLVVPQRRAVAELPSGVVFGWQDGSQRQRRTFTLAVHPYDWAMRASSSSAGTPLWGDSTRRWAPSATAGVVPAWGLSDFFATCLGGKCGALLGNFQSFLTGGVSTFDAVYVGADTLTAEAVQSLEQPNNSTWYRWPGVTLWRTAVESL